MYDSVYKPLCVVDLWDQADVCHGDLGGKQGVRRMSAFCATSALTSSSTQYIPDVSLRTGSRAGGEWCQSVIDQQL